MHLETIRDLIVVSIGFGIIALAAERIGRFFSKIHLPLITGFLFTGLIAGPFALNLIPASALEPLRIVDKVALAFIAFAAGSELYLEELRDRLRSIAWITVGLAAATYALGSLTMFWLSDLIPFMRALPSGARIAISLLTGTILVARSPSDAIAVINETRAKGPFTQTILGVTVIMDVVVIVLFAINTSVADAIIMNLRLNVGFVALLGLELLLSLALGLLLASMLHFILGLHTSTRLKLLLILAAGLGVFLLAAEVRRLSHTHLAFEIFLEPLLVCLVGSFVVTNRSSRRAEWIDILRANGLPIYVAFFTLTGASLELDVLAMTWPFALALFVARITGITTGSFIGGMVAREPAQHNRIRWLAFITQAGVALGLAKEVAVEFPEFGSSLATLIISVVVLNELIGPIAIKYALGRAGETHQRAAAPEDEGVRDAVIFGLEDQALALARQLNNHGWKVKVVALADAQPPAREEADVRLQIIPDFSLASLRLLALDKADAVVTLLSDEENYTICELVFEHFGTQDVVVRIHDRANFERFHALGALVVDPATAIVSLLDHMVRSPTAASLMLGMEADQDIVEFELRNPALDGMMLRDLRLPPDVLVISVSRDRHTIVSHGYTQLRLGDHISVLGSAQSLDEVMLKFDL
ncbi:MAG: cation:proton antiporter [Anaerolineales bacterium]